MMKFSRAAALLPLACLAIGGCRLSNPFHSSPKAPTGQVAATVYGEEITKRDLDAALGGSNFPDAATRKAAEVQVLNRLIEIKILARAAHDQKLDQTPDFALQKQWAIAQLAAQALERKSVTSVPPPSPGEVQRYVTDNPNMYGQRRVFTVDEVVFAMPTDAVALAKLDEDLKPIHTLDGIKAYLDANHIANKEQQGATMDAARAPDPALVARILDLPPHEPLVLQQGQYGVAIDVVSTQIQPLPNAQSMQLATALLTRQHAQLANSSELTHLFVAARPHININAAYRPPTAPAKPANAPAGKAAPAPAANAAGT